MDGITREIVQQLDMLIARGDGMYDTNVEVEFLRRLADRIEELERSVRYWQGREAAARREGSERVSEFMKMHRENTVLRQRLEKWREARVSKLHRNRCRRAMEARAFL
jgi:hypothetical protein